MCGIVGIARFGEEEIKNLRSSLIFIASNILEVTEVRGKDATGIAALFDDGNFVGQKLAKKASEFITRFGGTDNDYDGFIKILREYEVGMRVIIGHCRKKSVGGATQNVNNHPIKVNNIVGIHNGTLKNDDIIFKNLNCDRDGDVDSEAIFRLLDYYTKGCKEPFTSDILNEVFRRLEGSFSILAFNANNPNQLISAVDGRPAEYCLIKPLKCVLIASEKKFIEMAIWNYNKMAYNFGIEGFIKLKAKDVEYKTLKDDTAVIFDLTREINKDTKIDDLLDEQDIIKARDRIWKSYNETSQYSDYYNHMSYNRSLYNDYSTNNKKETDNVETHKKESKGNKGKEIGRAWNKKLEKYVSVKFLLENKKNKNAVVIDMERKIRMTIEETLELSKDTNIIDITDKSKISLDKKPKNIALPTKNIKDDLLNKKYLPVINKKVTKNVVSNLKEQAAETSVEEKEKSEGYRSATEFLQKIIRFKTTEEVATLCNTDVESLKLLRVPALANRILSHIFKETFVNGWVERNKKFKDSNKNIKKTEKHIRVLKAITSILDNVISEEVPKEKVKNWFDFILKYKDYNEINQSSIEEVFNKEALDNLPNIKEIKGIR